MPWLQVVDDFVEFFKVYSRVDRAVVHLKLVFEWLQQELIVEEVGVGEDQMRL